MDVLCVLGSKFPSYIKHFYTDRYLHYALDETKIRSQDTSYVFSYVANYNPIGRNIAWNFLKENWDMIYNK